MLAPSPVSNVNMSYQNDAIMVSEEEEKKEEEKQENTVQNILFGSGAGLVAVGGIGAGVVAHNNNKPKNVPIKKKNESANDVNEEEK